MLSTQASALAVSTVPLDGTSSLLDLLPETGPLAWVSGGEGLIGWGESARFEIAGPRRFEGAQAWWDEQRGSAQVVDEVGLPGTGLVAFGSFGFDAASSVLVVPRVVVGHREGSWWLTSVGPVAARPVPTGPPRPPRGVRFSDGSRDEVGWLAAVAEAVGRVHAGGIAKVVLARDLLAELEQPLDLRWPLQQLARGYPGCWTFAVDGLIGATPEMLVRLRDGRATSRVLAGTLRRTGDANKDMRQGDALARSIKDLEEHGYGVRSVADALSLHCVSLQVPPAPFVLELPNVMHLASDIVGTTKPGTSSFDLLADLHPSAAVCGSPTPAALEVIREIEGLDRGRYSGPVGWVDGAGNADWGIALRCGEVSRADRRRVRLFAGCGIVAGSVPARELAESNAKLVPMRSALQSEVS